uniref:Uncharacterized protein n=1 Tax=Cacopsylla melanoneura TaxID=428564 RepID=A0A8D8RGX4_9HEMI
MQYFARVGVEIIQYNPFLAIFIIIKYFYFFFFFKKMPPPPPPLYLSASTYKLMLYALRISSDQPHQASLSHIIQHRRNGVFFETGQEADRWGPKVGELSTYEKMNHSQRTLASLAYRGRLTLHQKTVSQISMTNP